MKRILLFLVAIGGPAFAATVNTNTPTTTTVASMIASGTSSRALTSGTADYSTTSGTAAALTDGTTAYTPASFVKSADLAGAHVGSADSVGAVGIQGFIDFSQLSGAASSDQGTKADTAIQTGTSTASGLTLSGSGTRLLLSGTIPAAGITSGTSTVGGLTVTISGTTLAVSGMPTASGSAAVTGSLSGFSPANYVPASGGTATGLTLVNPVQSGTSSGSVVRTGTFTGGTYVGGTFTGARFTDSSAVRIVQLRTAASFVITGSQASTDIIIPLVASGSNNTLAGWNDSTHVFTAPSSGWYCLSYNVNHALGNSTVQVEVSVNGGAMTALGGVYNGGFTQFALSCTYYLAASQTLALYGRCTGSTSTTYWTQDPSALIYIRQLP